MIILKTKVQLLLVLIGHLCSAGTLNMSFDTQFGRILETASRSQLYEFFREFPKGGILHLHSEYAVSPEFWLKIATADPILGGNEYFAKVREGSCSDETAKLILFVTVQRATWDHLTACEKRNFKRLKLLSVNEQDAWLKALKVDAAGGRKKFFEEIVPRLDDLWQDPNLMLEVIPEIVKEAASEHVLYLEIQFDPTSLHDAAGHPASTGVFIEMLKKRLARPDVAAEGVTVRFQMAAYRYTADSYKEFLNAFQFVDQHRDLWVGVNLLGEEGRPGGELSRFTSTLRKMRARYDIPLALHAGELDFPGHQVHDALILGASRIGHAVNLISDPDTMLLMRHGGIPIETSLVSNKRLEYTSDLSTHPFPLYLRAGIPMCLNTDDPGAWGGSLTDEFFLAATLYHLSWNEIASVARDSIRYAFVDQATKARLAARLNSELSNFETRMSADNWRPMLSQPLNRSVFAKAYLQIDQ
ncbi:MAG: adenosine deaminase [Acidobacteriota bacterium]|nr:adenosine deaminase [Acidobacteriota bacterium]